MGVALSSHGRSDVFGLRFNFSRSLSIFLLSFSSLSLRIFHCLNFSSNSILFRIFFSSIYLSRSFFSFSSFFLHLFSDFRSSILFLSHCVNPHSLSCRFLSFNHLSQDFCRDLDRISSFNYSFFFFSQFFISIKRMCFFSSSISLILKKSQSMSSLTLEISFSFSQTSVSFLSFQSS